MEEGNDRQHQKVGPGNTTKFPSIYVSDVTTILPPIQLLGQIAKQHELQALTNNQDKIQPKITDSYRAIVEALAEKRTDFHTYEPK
jgi:hypothetical protein